MRADRFIAERIAQDQTERRRGAVNRPVYPAEEGPLIGPEEKRLGYEGATVDELSRL
jgi:hypothetical protein